MPDDLMVQGITMTHHARQGCEDGLVYGALSHSEDWKTPNQQMLKLRQSGVLCHLV